MDLFSNFALGMQTALSPVNLIYCFLGVFLGTLIGVLPGIGSLAAISMLLPLTFHLEPTTALIMLAGIYYGSDYGGSISSILLRLAGSASSAVACLDGYPLARQGKAGMALFMTTVASFVGGSMGILILMLFAPMLAEVALAFGSAEYCMLMVLGLVACGSIAQGSPVKGTAMVLVGLLLGTVGIDMNSGVARYDFGMIELFDGIHVVVIAMAIFGAAEVIFSISDQERDVIQNRITLRSMLPSRDDVMRSIKPILRGSGIGCFVGVLPGAGGSIATFLSYTVEKRTSDTPERFGNGAVEGVVGPEASNNSAAQTAFVPTLTMGIPGSASMALLLGALMINGINPGPSLMREHPDIFWGLIMSFWIGNIMLVILNIPMIGIWVRLLQIPYRILFPIIICMICVGVYSVNNSVFDVMTLVVIAVVGYGMRLLNFEPAPLLIGFVLGPMLEENFRRAMVLARGDFTYFLTRPLSATLLLLTLMLIVWSIYSSMKFRRRITMSKTSA